MRNESLSLMPNLFYDIKHIKEQKTRKTLICCYFCQAETMTRKFPLFQFLNEEKKNLEEFGKIHSLESLPTKQKNKISHIWLSKLQGEYLSDSFFTQFSAHQ